MTSPSGEALGSFGMPDPLTIGAFARLTGLSAKALRNYGASGLLCPAAVVFEQDMASLPR